MPDLRSRLTALREILPASLERNLLIDEALHVCLFGCSGVADRRE